MASHLPEHWQRVGCNDWQIRDVCSLLDFRFCPDDTKLCAIDRSIGVVEDSHNTVTSPNHDLKQICLKNIVIGHSLDWCSKYFFFKWYWLNNGSIGSCTEFTKLMIGVGQT